ncbi:PIN domain-containing protein [Termitidicoccus mucosus]|uniref:PIN domain-containing protein n=1 Tax=Termitidicoccus mucosus TaxID=1184151 RepID=UPI0009FD5A3B
MKASAIDYMVDAGPLVALMNKSDQWHGWAAPTIRALGETLHTTEAMLAEVCHHLRLHRAAIGGLLAAIETGVLCMHPVFPVRVSRVRELMGKYGRMDLADATLVVLSEQYPRAKLITTDETDFKVYRRRDGSPVPAIMPQA